MRGVLLHLWYNFNMEFADVLLGVAVFVLGAIIGSFLNVVILRYNTGRSFIKGKSMCFSCQKELSARELIPLLSFILSRGKCRGCGSKISKQYPLVESVTGLIFLLSFYKIFVLYGFGLFFVLNLIYLWALFAFLIIITVYDLRHQIIPNVFVYVFDVLAFFNILFLENWSERTSYIVSGILFSGFFAALWVVSKGKWMGFGDAKLALGLGWFLGPALTVSAFLLSFWVGSIVSIFLLLFGRAKFTIKSKIALAPFLIFGALISYLFTIIFFGSYGQIF